MSLLAIVVQRLALITDQLNAIGRNAKKIDELPVQVNLEVNSKIHVSNKGVSESLTLANIIDSILSKTYSKLLSVGNITVYELVVNVPAGVQWVYAGINYSTTTATNINMTLCTTGFLRKDILVANQLSQIILVKGVESETFRVMPNLPIGCVLVAELDVDDIDADINSEYTSIFRYTNQIKQFSVPSNLKVMSITLNEGRVLRKSKEWTRISPTQIGLSFDLVENDTIYITGLKGFDIEYSNLFTYSNQIKIFTIPSRLRIMNVILNEGRILRKDIEWIRQTPSQIGIIMDLEQNDTIYITGLN